MPINLVMLTADDKLAEIRRLYFETTKEKIRDDLDRALQLLKSMDTEEERERATVYMEGLAQMRSDWTRQAGGKGKGGRGKHRGAKGGAGKSGTTDGKHAGPAKASGKNRR